MNNWSKKVPKENGDFYYHGHTPKKEEKILAIVQITTIADGRRIAWVLLPEGWRGDVKRKSIIYMDEVENWEGEWAGPEFGLCCKEIGS